MSDNTVNRRQFLKITGCGAVVALTGAGCSLAAKKAEASCPFGMNNDPYPGECSRYIDTNGTGFCDLSEAVLSQSENTGSASENVVQSQPQSAAASGQTMCSRGCSYPGHCDRYMDTNGTGVCDLSEFTAAEAQVAGGELAQAAAQPGRGGSGRGGRH